MKMTVGGKDSRLVGRLKMLYLIPYNIVLVLPFLVLLEISTILLSIYEESVSTWNRQGKLK